MTIEQLDSTKVLISLCAQDMKNYSLEFDTMDFEKPHCKKILTRLLAIACEKTGFNIDDGYLLVEALPYDNGCLILITASEKRGRRIYKIKKNNRSLCCVFEDTESFITAVLQLAKSGLSLYPNSAYFYNEKYYLVFACPALPKRARVLLSEYARVMLCNRSFAARLSESGKIIAKKNAVKIISKSFEKKTDNQKFSVDSRQI